MFSAIARAVSGGERREESVPLLPRDVEAGSDDVAGEARFGRSRGTIAGTGARDALEQLGLAVERVEMAGTE